MSIARRVEQEVNTVLEKKYADAIATPMSDVAVTQRTKDFILKNPLKHRGSVRVFTGRLYTNKQFDRMRKKTLAKKLP
jgi:hypothetical protein